MGISSRSSAMLGSSFAHLSDISRSQATFLGELLSIDPRHPFSRRIGTMNSLRANCSTVLTVEIERIMTNFFKRLPILYLFDYSFSPPFLRIFHRKHHTLV